MRTIVNKSRINRSIHVNSELFSLCCIYSCENHYVALKITVFGSLGRISLAGSSHHIIIRLVVKSSQSKSKFKSTKNRVQVHLKYYNSDHHMEKTEAGFKGLYVYLRNNNKITLSIHKVPVSS